MFEYINNNDITMVVMLSKFHFLYYNSVMSVVCVVCICSVYVYPHPHRKYPLQLPPFLSRLLLLQPPVTCPLTLLFINHLPLKHLQQTSQWIITPHDTVPAQWN